MKAALVACVLAPALAAADTPRDLPAAIEVDREAAPPGRAEFSFDGGAPVYGWAASLSEGFVDNPITLRAGDVTSHPVRHRETTTLGVALALGFSAVLDVQLGMAHQVGDRLAILGDPRGLDHVVPTDLAIGARVRVVESPYASVFLRGALTLPTGDDRDFAGEPSWTAAWHLIGRFTLPAGIVVAATGGIRLRGDEVMLADKVIGDELSGAVGVAVPIPPIHPLWCDREQLRVTAELAGVLGDEVGGASGPSPAEARFGVVGMPRQDLAIRVGVGTGLGDEIGAPAWRAMIELTYHGDWTLIPPPQPGHDLDTDED